MEYIILCLTENQKQNYMGVSKKVIFVFSFDISFYFFFFFVVILCFVLFYSFN